MTTDKRLKLTHLIKKMTDESVEQLLETACKLFAANEMVQRPNCPYCQSSSIVKNGHKCGKQEYRGVATKYLNRYNALFGFAFRQIDGALTRLKSLLLNVSIVDRSYSIRNTVSVGLLAV